MGALTMFVLQVYNLFVIYLSRPVSTVVKVEHESVSISFIDYQLQCMHVIDQHWSFASPHIHVSNHLIGFE